MKQKSNKVKYLTVAIILYMLAALTWWSVLLLRMNSEILALKRNGIADSQDLIQDFDKQQLMIISEGVVFGLALVIGIYLLYRSYKKEVRLTQSQNNFLLSVTHELKTPLSVLKLINQTVVQRNLTDEKRIELLTDGEQEITRLESMVNNLLTSTKIDHEYQINKESVLIDGFVKQLTGKMKNRWPGVVTLDLRSNAKILIDQELFETALLNLIDNAFQYSMPEPEVIIKSSVQDNSVHIDIIDNGIGIDKNEASKIFNKFYRVGSEETRKTKGTGLGLYLSSEIIKMHRGEIILKNNKPKGSIFSLIIPV